jgi:hypothetical protein
MTDVVLALRRSEYSRRMLVADDFQWDEYFWTADVVVEDERLASGPVPMVFAPEGRGAEPLTADELARLRVAASTLDVVAALAVSAIYDQYTALQLAYDFDDDDRAAYMPDVNSAEEIYDLINIVGVNVHQVSRDGLPYVGIEFATRWDPEHGAGVLINGERVVEVGGADSAILLWIAERDLQEGAAP